MEGTAPQNPARGGAGKMLHGDGCVRWGEIPRVSPHPIHSRQGSRTPCSRRDELLIPSPHTRELWKSGCHPSPESPPQAACPPLIPDPRRVYRSPERGEKNKKREKEKEKKKSHHQNKTTPQRIPGRKIHQGPLGSCGSSPQSAGHGRGGRHSGAELGTAPAQFPWISFPGKGWA